MTAENLRNVLRLAVVCLSAGLVAACVTTQEDYRKIEPTVDIIVPEGPGPFPGVVVLHNCSGLDGTTGDIPAFWAKLLVENGYAVALPDSFRPRGLQRGVCTRPLGQWPLNNLRAADAHQARRMLQQHPKVDPNRIAVTGGSNGGVALMAAANTQLAEAGGWLADGKPNFKAGIPFYPECAPGQFYGNWKILSRRPLRTEGSYSADFPMLILIGEVDDWTPAPSCTALVNAHSGAKIDIKIYPRAHHAFDAPSLPVTFSPNATNINGSGATSGQNPEAWKDSQTQVLAYLRRHIGGGK